MWRCSPAILCALQRCYDKIYKIRYMAFLFLRWYFSPLIFLRYDDILLLYYDDITFAAAAFSYYAFIYGAIISAFFCCCCCRRRFCASRRVIYDICHYFPLFSASYTKSFHDIKMRVRWEQIWCFSWDGDIFAHCDIIDAICYICCCRKRKRPPAPLLIRALFSAPRQKEDMMIFSPPWEILSLRWRYLKR